MSFNAAPEDVRAGENIALYGRLTPLTPDEGYAGKTLTIQFKPRGGSFADYTTLTTDADGRYSKKVVAKGDGKWRVRFAGTRDHHSETSRHDFIDVN